MPTVNSLYYLMYASTESAPSTQAELLDLLRSARRFNEAHQITGLLLYSPGTRQTKGTFVQILEGERTTVLNLFDVIRKDARHEECTIVKDGPLLGRRFGDWTMGFRDVSTLELEDVPGYNPIFLKDWSIARILNEPDPILQLAYSFASSA